MIKNLSIKYLLTFAIAMVFVAMQTNMSQAARIYNNSSVNILVYPWTASGPTTGASPLWLKPGEKSDSITWSNTTAVMICGINMTAAKAEDAEHVNASGVMTGYGKTHYKSPKGFAMCNDDMGHVVLDTINKITKYTPGKGVYFRALCDTFPRADMQGGNFAVVTGGGVDTTEDSKFVWHIDGVAWTCEGNNLWTK